MSPYYCCKHCEHDVNSAPHTAPCLEGCSDDGLPSPVEDIVAASIRGDLQAALRGEAPVPQ